MRLRVIGIVAVVGASLFGVFVACSGGGTDENPCFKTVVRGCPGFPLTDANSTADGRRDTSTSGLDAEVEPDADTTDAEGPTGPDFVGKWDAVAGLEGYPVWFASNPRASLKPLTWGPCIPVTAGCQELVVDWTPERGKERFDGDLPDDKAFYKEGGRSFFVYRRVFPMPGLGNYRAFQTVVEELGVGPVWAVGERPPFNTAAGRSFGGHTFGFSARPRGTRKLINYAIDVDTHGITRATQDLAPLNIPQDDIGLAYNYGTHFTFASAAIPLTTIAVSAA